LWRDYLFTAELENTAAQNGLAQEALLVAGYEEAPGTLALGVLRQLNGRGMSAFLNWLPGVDREADSRARARQISWPRAVVLSTCRK